MSSALEIIRGDHAVITVEITGLSVDQLAGASARFVARQRADDPAPMIDFDGSDASDIDINANDLEIVIVIDPTDLQYLPEERIGLMFDVEVSPSDGSGPVTVSQGRLIVNPDIAR